MTAQAKPMTVSAGDFDAQVLQTRGPVLVEFMASWHQPCVAMGPTMDRLANRFDGQAKVVKVDVEDNQSLAVMFGILTLPTVLVFHNGAEVERLQGSAPEDVYALTLAPYVNRVHAA